MHDIFNAEKMLLQGVNEGIEKMTKADEEWVWIEGYKGTNDDMTCRDQQYEIGKTYVMPEGSDIKACESGFHLCLGLIDVFDYYSIGNGRRYFKVKALVRKSDLDNMAEPRAYIQRRYGLNGDPPLDDKISAKSIEFIRELTVDEIFENTYAKDWSEEHKKMALEQGLNAVDDMIKRETREKERQEQEDKLVELGYSRPFAALIIKDGKYDKAYAVGTQSDLSMDMKVLTIFR